MRAYQWIQKEQIAEMFFGHRTRSKHNLYTYCLTRCICVIVGFAGLVYEYVCKVTSGMILVQPKIPNKRINLLK